MGFGLLNSCYRFSSGGILLRGKSVMGSAGTSPFTLHVVKFISQQSSSSEPLPAFSVQEERGGRESCSQSHGSSDTSRKAGKEREPVGAWRAISLIKFQSFGLK